jgi:hypothetical protein
MAKIKNNDPLNTLRINPRFLEDRILINLKHFGRMDKLLKEFSLDELADWYLHSCHEKTKKTHFLGALSPSYKFPYQKEFPKSPILEDNDEQE